jgi:DNA-binding IclR family transcriptional regulator
MTKSEQILRFIEVNPHCTNTEIADTLGVPKSHISSATYKLFRKGKVLRNGSSICWYYRVDKGEE